MNNATRPPETAASTFDFGNATRTCDIVMKGGVTSGVVYPLAICALAETYRFVNIGGTSAGAIAAAATAAAELGRRRARGTSFDELAKLPEWLGDSSGRGKKSNLFNLFQPDPESRRLFAVLTAAIGGRKGLAGKIATGGRVAAAAVRHYPLWLLLGAVPAALFLRAALGLGSGWLMILSLIFALLLLPLATAIGGAAGVVLDAVRTIPRNRFGLCKGHLRVRAGTPQPISTWMTDYLDDLAGTDKAGRPLTFGDLWDLSAPHDQRAIDLQMMTTCLTQGQPYRLPFTKPTRHDTDPSFYFRREEMLEYFPERVVAWMEQRSALVYRRREFPGFLPVPYPEDFPVVVAARMSLSFPILFSAVPLYSVDYTRKSIDHRPELCLFADGGICSNFPVHFFDAPLPGHPTFAINLRPFRSDYPHQDDECRNIWGPRTNGEGSSNQWYRMTEGSGFGAVQQFLGLITNAMQNWSDNTQLCMPGFRDRIVHVYQTPEEGGMNLDMPKERITALSMRGRCAGELLTQRFTSVTDGVVVSWSNHRWVRYRSTMAQLETFLDRFSRAYDAPSGDDVSYGDLIARDGSTPPASYPFTQAQREFAVAETEHLAEMARRWRRAGVTFGDNAPRPEPELRTRPKV